MLKLIIDDCLGESEVEVGPEEREQVYRAVVRYIAKLTSVDGLKREVVKAVKHLDDLKEVEDIKRRVNTLKKESLDRMDYFIRGLWRATYEAIRYELKAEYLAAVFAVEALDIEFMTNRLSEKEWRQIRRSTIPTKLLPQNVVDECREEIVKHAKRKCRQGKKGGVKFIYNNDAAFDQEDFLQDFILEGWRVFMHYEHLNNPAKTLNYARQAITNYAINTINYHQSEKRQVLRRVEENDPAFAERTFHRPKISMSELTASSQSDSDRSLNEDRLRTPENDSVVELMYADIVRTPESNAMDHELIRSLQTAELNPKVAKFVDMVMGGEIDKGFREWLQRYHHLKIDEVQFDYIKLGSLVRQYLNVSTSKLAKQLGLYVGRAEEPVDKKKKKEDAGVGPATLDRGLAKRAREHIRELSVCV